MVTTIEGVARNVDWQTVPKEQPRRTPLDWSRPKQTEHVPQLQFRVEEVDDVGNPTGYTSVVASASSPEELPDFIADGDEVEVTGQVTGVIRDGPMEAYKLTNLTTGTTVTLKRWWGPRTLLLWIAMGVIFVPLTFAFFNEEPGLTVAGLVILALLLLWRRYVRSVSWLVGALAGLIELAIRRVISKLWLAIRGVISMLRQT